MNTLAHLPPAQNEPVYGYEPGTAHRRALEAEVAHLRGQQPEVPLYIGAERVFTGEWIELRPPHDTQHLLGRAARAGEPEIQRAIDAALAAKPAWEALPWEERAAIFLRAADLMTTRLRYRTCAATMLAQAKTCHQSEIDAVCEMADFLRFNVRYAAQLYAQQPDSPPGQWNRLDYRPLEGFVVAITPFNFTSIGGNLPTSPAIMGNTVVWKPADTQIYSAQVFMELLLEAGLPPGVINLIYPRGSVLGRVAFSHPQFAGLHFTGSTETFQYIWQTVAGQLGRYRSYPRIVGETGGKDFIIAHPSSDPAALATAIVRGGYEFQGQKCSAASRVYLPASLEKEVTDRVVADLTNMPMGPVEDFRNFFSAVIDQASFDRIKGYIDHAYQSPDLDVTFGGEADATQGYYIRPTWVKSHVPKSKLMEEEIFGPVVTYYVYPDAQWAEALQLVDETSPYALTGAVFSQDRYAVQQALQALRHSAGNFYINDKPTGAVVNQQPFGGGRASGTNDKAGSFLNLVRWVSARAIKENLLPPTDYRYPFMG